MAKDKKEQLEEYEVGYRKPPQRTQFKKGQSGNPKGRPKKSLNLNTLNKKELSKKVILHENGRRQKITKAEAISKRLVANALNGHMSAIKALMGAFPEDKEAESLFQSSVEDTNVLEHYLNKMGDFKQKPEKTDDNDND